MRRLKFPPKEKSARSEAGFGLIEILVTIGIASIFLVSTAQLFPLTLKQLRNSEQESRALFFAQDAIEATKNIQNQSFALLAKIPTNTPVHPEIHQDEWRMVEGSETIAPFYEREVRFFDIRRDENGDIVEQGGNVDPNIRKAEARVQWPTSNGNQEKKLSTYVSDWKYSNAFIHALTQTEDNDFQHGSGTAVDLVRFPGTIRLDYQLLTSENFESYPPSYDPPTWYDTGANYNLNPNPDLFKTDFLDTMVFGTNANPPNIHSHYIGAGASDWTNYEYSGRMMITDTAGKMGMTFFSKYASEDKYYMLANTDADGSFMISGRRTSITPQGVDDRDTEVAPVANVWYRFRIQAKNVNNQTLIVAKVWKDGDAEPASWQVDCFDDSASRSSSGTVGIWADRGGDKYIDDVEVRDLTRYASQGVYESMNFDTSSTSQFDRLQWNGDLPAGTTAAVRLRSAETQTGLTSAPWMGPTSPIDSYNRNGLSQPINGDHSGDQWIQYRLELSTSNASFTPAFDQMTLFYAPQ